ncbi:sn-glycerol-3-phosphate ABC transporter ATP-binding protein UgpC [Collimonas sp.]|jgi:multiple sugar transport system ATP-binding protein|uniref:ABC transporter ATP-binding protein n=1 Tax=Collimonas sp. TaxID=1963772 RepID=UPI002C023C1D|nr:sn-glycerol-3-phosphate ABC transporter ATP-binding protein UgpC [Collimonas sp.]HWW99480.1 sn-glycerol-3-phosphate ABC transporter ATP-binding protein UgpC [Collimonas sp.]
MVSVVLKDIRKTYEQVEVLKGVDLDIREGEFCVFVGPSGCGKSTLLRMIAGLESISSGELWIDGQLANDIAPAKRGLAMVFQSYALYPHMTVAENMGFGLRLAGKTKAEIAQRVRDVATILQLETLLDRKPKALSGGQRQRVAIGRAIARDPKVFLFDEPLSNLDAELRVRMRIELARLHEQLGTTMIYVTHDQVEAMTLADKIVVLDGGIVQQVGSPLELYTRPANRFVAGFIGSPKMNFIEAEAITQGNDACSTILLANKRQLKVRTPASGSLKQGEAVTLGIRPEHLTLSEHGAIPGEIEVVERLGSETYIHLNIGLPLPLVIKVYGNPEVRLHQAIAVDVMEDQCHLFDSNEHSHSR